VTLAQHVARIAAQCDVELDARALREIVDHADAVLNADARLQLTAIDAIDEFVDRHIGESLQASVRLPHDCEGTLLDLGSGNGYPGLPLVAVHRGLTPVLAESSSRKAAFLRRVLDSRDGAGHLLERHVENAADAQAHAPYRVIVTRAMGGWEKVLPRLAATLSDDGEIFLWAGGDVETVARRKIWQRLELRERYALHGRDRTAIWRFVRSCGLSG